MIGADADIVDRLRSNRWTGQHQQKRIRAEAADEIVQLRRHVRRLLDDVDALDARLNAG